MLTLDVCPCPRPEMRHLDPPTRPYHNLFSYCQMGPVYPHADTADEAAWWLMRMCAEPEDDGYCDQVEQLVRDYFTSHPSGVVRIGNYTPRGRKRRGLHTKQHRLFCVQTGTVRHYFPGVVFCGSPGYDTPTVTLTRTRATVPCRCYGVDRSVVPLHTIVWAAPN